MPAITLLVSAILLIGLDQVSKVFILSRLREGQAKSFGWIAFRRVLNLRCDGFLAGRGTLFTLWAAEVILFVALVQFGPFFQGATAQVALGMALGGAGGNLMDKLWRGGVVDFIDFGFWPVFNIADTAIIVGGVTGALYM
ncbi:MAG: signal peptidase II [Pyrinomonadaceae bacterium]|nr:signal peptidase II [Pyrinomonadaceae bacterium]